MNPDRIIASAKRIIAKNGIVVQWTKAAPQDETAKPWRDIRDGAPVVIEVPIAFFSPSDVGKGGELFRAIMGGTEVAGSTEIGLMAGGQEFEPEIADTFVRNGARLNVIKFDRLAPQTIPLLYFVWIG